MKRTITPRSSLVLFLASLLREGDRIAVEGVLKPLTNFLHGIISHDAKLHATPSEDLN